MKNENNRMKFLTEKSSGRTAKSQRKLLKTLNFSAALAPVNRKPLVCADSKVGIETPIRAKKNKSPVTPRKVFRFMSKDRKKTRLSPPPLVKLKGRRVSLRNSSRKFTNSNSEADIAQQKNQQCYSAHFSEVYSALSYLGTLPPLDFSLYPHKQKKLHRPLGCENKKTVILDLDETLIHCCRDDFSVADFIITIGSPPELLGICIRPNAQKFLKSLSGLFEVVLFTASQKPYADAILEYLDPLNKYIHHRLYREDCIEWCGMFTKDLRIFCNRKLTDLVIVDNSVYSFFAQLDNGIPIITWNDNPHDTELCSLTHYLTKIKSVPDIRVVNRKVFNLNTIVN